MKSPRAFSFTHPRMQFVTNSVDRDNVAPIKIPPEIEADTTPKIPTPCVVEKIIAKAIADITIVGKNG